jgi:ubiquitin C-terminal hydrolase
MCPQLVGTKETVHYVECSKCGYRTDRTKFDRIAVAPRVLQLQIKRVTTDPSGLRQFKSDTPVDFPLVLHVSESLLDGKSRPPAAYDLHAVSLHLGTPGTPTAHFITFVRRGFTWYVINDAEHEELSASESARIGQGDRLVSGLTYVARSLSSSDGAN